MKYDAGFFESGIGSFLSTFDGKQPNEGWMINFLGSNLRTTIGMDHRKAAYWKKAALILIILVNGIMS
ncbi:hypothetical protein NXY28_23630 [Bacteroides thetaiotaomicron]|nr:hypothetical protein NXY28_23630 [Bacteroides thetaiotaomicron]